MKYIIGGVSLFGLVAIVVLVLLYVPLPLGNPTQVILPVGNDLIRVVSIQIEKDTISITGEARGYWYFEGSFPIEVLTDTNNIHTQAIATAMGEWMTTEFVPFEAKVAHTLKADTTATLVFKKDNPSGLSELDDQFSIPIFISF